MTGGNTGLRGEAAEHDLPGIHVTTYRDLRVECDGRVVPTCADKLKALFNTLPVRMYV